MKNKCRNRTVLAQGLLYASINVSEFRNVAKFKSVVSDHLIHLLLGSMKSGRILEKRVEAEG